MWFVPTRGRPDRLQTFLDAAELTSVGMPGLIVVDGADGGDYSGVRLPYNWSLEVAPERLGPAGRMEAFFKEHPDEPFYSIVNDDVVPITRGWDRLLVEEAGAWNMAYPDDGNDGGRMATQFVLGGDLVRAVGSISLGFIHTQQDRAWMDIARAIDRLRYRGDILLRHDHWTTGRGERDATYDKKINGRSTIKMDRLRYAGFITELPALLKRIKEVVPCV